MLILAAVTQVYTECQCTGFSIPTGKFRPDALESIHGYGQSRFSPENFT